MTLVLASRSPQRRAILEQLGVAFAVAVRRRRGARRRRPARGRACENARRKARRRSRRAGEGELVLGVDTRRRASTSRIWGKPRRRRRRRARRCGALAGRTHAVRQRGRADRGRRATSGRRRRRRGSRFRDARRRDCSTGTSRRGEWRGRAGGYAIQGRGAALVDADRGRLPQRRRAAGGDAARAAARTLHVAA